MSTLFRRKPVAIDHRGGTVLARTLSWPHLVALGVGAIVGTGILTLIGVGAERAGPAVILSFVIAGAICACAALAYAEMATMIPASGSAYTYSYVVLGEVIAWVIGWSLILEYSLVVSTVAVGWSGYASALLTPLGFPVALTQGPELGGVVNLPAVFIIAVVAGLLSLGTKESATLNAVLVGIKLVALAVFVAVAVPHFDAANLEPFMPYGFAKSVSADGGERGVMAAAAIIFFAFYGFDAISTAAEETKNPGRDLSIGIVGSMLACVVIYMGVAVAAVGALHFSRFADSPEPLALILRGIGRPGFATFLAASAVIALPTVLLGFLFGQSRIFFVMARDGLLPQALAKVSKRGTPVRITMLTAILVAVIAGVMPIDAIAALANAGTLAAFVAVCVCMLVMRRRAPDAERRFRTPAAPLVGAIGVLGCAYLFFSLPQRTQLYFLLWNLFGLAVYLLWGRRRAAIAAAA
ncbi:MULTISPECIES: amino acid permease [unclassified Sphingomonas]|uniref:amino acid permease n=1 Tax=unclassified Sphingomonas TaxID=196159 RepID=UPI0016196410|nr:MULTISPECIES: amino acid permease [unclassified Sphingomonas]MBB3346878.1 APA family basic amino acid/polyamine antiporter [Sphingomonas sp. BK069]MBB3475662.1 APA family basic amino acid/polyamine antiporter [Sphingomonas sp. BK345]